MMVTESIDISKELLAFFGQTRLADRPRGEQIQAALAIHLYIEDVISIGKAAQLAGIPRLEFEQLLITMDVPIVRYGIEEYEQDQRTLEKLRQADQAR